MKKVLLTGASGGLGLYLAKALLKNDTIARMLLLY